MVRWWNGVSWSDVATPAGPGVAVQSSPVLAPPARPVEPVLLQTPRDTATKTPWIVGISLLVLVAVVGAALFLGSSSDATPTADPAVPSDQFPGPQQAPDQAFPPGT